MRRPALMLVLAAAVGVAVILLAGTGSSGYRVAAIFDNAKGMVSGQQVKVAGVAVGSVQQVDLMPHDRAMIVMSVQRRFEPFHADASCSIRPEGLISENFVQCDPGRSAQPLALGTNGVATVPVTQTAEPVSLQDLLNVFSVPTDQRLELLLHELGIGLAGRGTGLNAILRRTNPALVQAQRVLSIVDAQRSQLANAVTQTDGVLAALATRRQQVRQFVDQTAAVARNLAEHQAALSATVNRLPALLHAVRPGMASLDRVATNAGPLLDALRTTAPQLDALAHEIPEFTAAGTPAIRGLANAAASGLSAIPPLKRTATQLDRATQKLAPLASELAPFTTNLRNTGGIEGLLRLIYSIATTTSGYDSVSHIASFFLEAAPNCLIAEQLGSTPAGCSHTYTSPGHGTIPFNDPACGPQQPSEIWNTSYCHAAVPALPLRRTDRRPRTREVPRMRAAAAPTPSAKNGASRGTSQRTPAPPAHSPAGTGSGVTQSPPAQSILGPLSSLLKYLLMP